MEKIDAFTLEKHDGPYEKWPRRTRLFFRGKDTGKKIPGYLIEGQYRCATGYVLITSQDCPFEESNDLLLLNANFEILANAELLVPYCSFLLHAHWPVSEHAIRLHYYDDLVFTLSIQKKNGFLGERYALELERLEHPDADPETAASIAELQKRLDAVEKLHAHRDESKV